MLSRHGKNLKKKANASVLKTTTTSHQVNSQDLSHRDERINALVNSLFLPLSQSSKFRELRQGFFSLPSELKNRDGLESVPHRVLDISETWG